MTYSAMTDYVEEIKRLKREKNAILLAHYYQEPEIQDLADVIGDSLELARAAQKAKSPLIVFCGVHFMAEGAKILNPASKVLLPDLMAGCSLSDDCPPDEFLSFRKSHPEYFAITYINCSAAVKANSDVICTSSNAERMIEKAPKDRPILFAPDRNLGAYLQKKTGRTLHLWPGSCIVHETFSEKKILDLMVRNPEAELIAHPECEEHLLRHTHFIGSTSGLLKYVQQSPKKTFIVATEAGILHQMKLKCPDKTFIAAPPNEACSCNNCPYMKLNTLEKVYLCLRDETPEITLPENIRLAALKPLELMLEWSR